MSTQPAKRLRTAIAVLSYNNKDLVQKYLPKIHAFIPDDVRHETKVFVINNAGTDGVLEWVKENYSDVGTVDLPVNKGFTNGYNEGLQHIEAENLVLISSDVDVSEGWLMPCIELLESDEKIAAVSPKIMDYFKPEYFEYAGAAGGFIDILGYPFCRGRVVTTVEKDEGQYNDSKDIFWASGACLFIKGDRWKEAQGFDNDFFAHMEEIDLAWRLKRMGYRIVTQPNSKVFHMGGAVIKYGSPMKVYRNHRNNLLMLIKNLPGTRLLWVLPTRVALDYVVAFQMLFQGKPKLFFTVFKAHLNVTANLSLYLKKRKALKKETKTYRVGQVFKGSMIVNYFLKNKKLYSDFAE